MQLRTIRGWEGNSTCKMSAWWNFCPQSLDKMGGKLTTKKNILISDSQSGMSDCRVRYLLSTGNYCWFEVHSPSWFLMPINHTSHPDFRSILQKPINVNIRMQSCLQVIDSRNHTQVAKSCKVTVGGPDRHYFIPRLVELHVAHWAMLTSHCGCNAVCVCVLAARFITCLLVQMMCASFMYRETKV